MAHRSGRQPVEVASWNEFFMNTAKMAAQRSKDPTCQVGACIANKANEVVGVGYNCMPRGRDDLFDCWSTSEKHNYVCHAELNAIVNSKCSDFSDCRMYVTRIPCEPCTKLIVQCNIKEVYYILDKKGEIAKEIFNRLTPQGFKLREYINIGAQ